MTAFCVSILLLIGCSKAENTQSDKHKITKEEADKLSTESLEKNSEVIVILSLKYKLRSDQTKDILKGYETGRNSFYNFGAGVKGKKDTELIYDLSHEYSIPQEKVAGIIFDYKMWKATIDNS